MSHEVAAADAGMHAERSALVQAAQRGGAAVWYSTEDAAYIAAFPSEPTISGIGDTPGLALVELLIATRMGLESARADLDTLRNGVVWLGAELDRARRWGALWKRAAKGQWNRAEWWRWRHGDVRRAARLLVVAWRQAKKNEATARSMGWELYGLLKDWQTCEEMREPGDKPCGVCQICRALVAWKAAYGSPQNDPATE